jgi:glutathione S-transferase
VKLFVNQTSPYARKVRMVVLEKGLQSDIETVDVDPWADTAALIAVSPLSKVPALVTDAGLLVTESDTISQFLDEQSSRTPLLSTNSSDRIEAKARMALLQGMIDAAFDAVIEKRRPEEKQWVEWVARQRRAVERGLAVVEDMPRMEGRFDLGDISLVALLGYLDFRHADLDWRSTCPSLSEWYRIAENRPSVIATRPKVPV